MAHRIAFAALALSLLTSAGGAQGARRYLGVDAGALRATLVGSDAEGATGRMAPFAGATLVLQPADVGFGLLTGLYYAPRGAQFSTTGLDQKVRLSYLEIPIIARYQLPLLLRGTRIGSAVLGGLTLGINPACSIETRTATALVSTGCNATPAGRRISVGSLDAALAAGVEFMVPTSSGVLFVPSIRYSRSVVDLGAGARVREMKNAALQLGVGVRRPF